MTGDEDRDVSGVEIGGGKGEDDIVDDEEEEEEGLTVLVVVVSLPGEVDGVDDIVDLTVLMVGLRGAAVNDFNSRCDIQMVSK